MKKIRNSSRTALALLALATLSGIAGAQTIYVDDSWGATPARSNATTPYEGQVEDRIWYNPHTNTYATTPGAEDGVTNGIDWVPTGLEAKEYYPLAASYGDPVPASMDDPTTDAIEADPLVAGTNAFSTMKDAFLRIAAAPAGSYNKIVILSGTYYETVFIPNNTLNNATNNAYYGVPNSDFYGKFQTNFTITGTPTDKPMFTRGMVMDGENTDGMTIANLVLTGIPGTNGNGVQTGTSHRIVAVNLSNQALVYPGLTAQGVRKDLTLRGLVIDGMKNRLPFSGKQPLNTTYFPGYTTQPANNNIVSTSGGRGGIVLDGEYGTLRLEDSTFRGIRSFWTFDTNGSGNDNATWTTFYAERNTLEDCWGNFAIRGEEPEYAAGVPQAGQRQPVAGVADDAIVRNNTVRNMGEGILELKDLGATGSNNYLVDHAPNSGAAMKVFNVRNLLFENNTITRVNIMQDWFAKSTKVPPGNPAFIPMGGGLIIRDFRWSGTLAGAPPYGPWSDLTTVTIRGNLFEYCQQGIGFDSAGLNQKFIPDGVITNNRFFNNRTAVFFYDSLISSQALSLTDNIITETNPDPFETGIGATADDTVVGGVVFDAGAGVITEAAAPPPLDLSNNFFGGDPAANDGIVLDGGVTGGTVTGEAPGEFATVITNPDPDADGIASILEDANGNSTVDAGETDPAKFDTDNDGLGDGLELRLGYDPTDPASPSSTDDDDNDRLPNSVEAALGTLPNNADSDGDGIRDDYEVQFGTNPLAADSIVSDFGDANGDGVVDNVDATRVLEAFLDINVLNVTNTDKLDINRDGRTDNVDAIIIFNFQVGNILYIPFP